MASDENEAPNRSENENDSDNVSPTGIAINDPEEQTEIDRSGDSSFSPSANKMNVLRITAPPGPLGLMMKKGQYLNRGCVVSGLRDSSPLLGQLFPGDIIAAVDDEDVSSMNVKELATVISNKVDKTRVITVHSNAISGSVAGSVMDSNRISLKGKGMKGVSTGGAKPGAIEVSDSDIAKRIYSSGLKTSKFDDRLKSSLNKKNTAVNPKQKIVVDASVNDQSGSQFGISRTTHSKTQKVKSSLGTRHTLKEKRIKEQYTVLRGPGTVDDLNNKNSENKAGNILISQHTRSNPGENSISSMRKPSSHNGETTSNVQDVAGNGLYEHRGTNQGAILKDGTATNRNGYVENSNGSIQNGAEEKNHKRKNSFFIGLILSTILVVGGIIVPVIIAVTSKSSPDNPREVDIIAPVEIGPISNVWTIDFALFYLCGSGTEGKLSREQKSNLEEALIMYANTVNNDVNFTAANVANFVQPECCNAVDVTSACIDALFYETETIVDFDLSGQCSVLCEDEALPPEDSVRVLRELQRRENRRLFVEIIQRVFNETLATVQVAEVEQQVLLPCAIGTNECDVEGSCCGIEGCLCIGVSNSLCNTNKCDLPGGQCCDEGYSSCLDTYSEVCNCQSELNCTSYIDGDFFSSESESLVVPNYINCCQYNVCGDSSSCQCDVCSDGSNFERDEKIILPEGNNFTCDFLEAYGNYLVSGNETTCEVLHVYGDIFCGCPASTTNFGECGFCSTFNSNQEITFVPGIETCGILQLTVYSQVLENETFCDEDIAAYTRLYGHYCGCPLGGNNAELPDGVEACSLCKGAEILVFDGDDSESGSESNCEMFDAALRTVAADDEMCAVSNRIVEQCCVKSTSTSPSPSSSSPSFAVPYESIWNMTMEIDYSCGEYTFSDEGRLSSQIQSNLESSLLDYANQLSLISDNSIVFEAANIAYFQPSACSTPFPTPNPIFSGTLSKTVQQIDQEAVSVSTGSTTSSKVVYSLIGRCLVQCNDVAIPSLILAENSDIPSFAAISTEYGLPTTRNLSLISQQQMDCTQGTQSCTSGACCGFENCACQYVSESLCAIHSCDLPSPGDVYCSCLSTSYCSSELCYYKGF